ncbi:kinase-like protein [Xylona heveae TC161]|uniref:non-specific serine/threonine protein kinase n=1 Tax=Xylona heveae (strain CBS 132557 / TC161) TaxID=1328760 RepID=A0A165HXW8_XYLHT|nr:kinase-like protein [Xylona heveae TC161]KZF24079.1 kinase-like protein [Xylona heveae TC161]
MRQPLIISSWRTHSSRLSGFHHQTISFRSSRLPETDDTCFDVQYVPLEGVENLERYRPGGYHPIVIGECLHDRYDIVHKLGSGGFSTIWLANDRTTGRYVAVKVNTAAASLCRESSILRQLNSTILKRPVHPGKSVIPHILGEFSLDGPNGKHQCLVTVPARMNINEAKDASRFRLFQLPVARAIIAQLVQGVAFLHSQGIAHADLHLGNILLRLPASIQRLSPAQFYEKYGQPSHEPVVRFDNQTLPQGVPTHGIMPVWLGDGSENISLSEAEIFLTDYGESFMPSMTPRYYSNTPDLLVPPEVYFLRQKPLSFSADIWALAIIMWSIMGQKEIFEAHLPYADWMIKEHVETLGKLPREWWSTWEARLKWFNEDGVRVDGCIGRPLEERFRTSIQKPRLEDGEVGEVCKEEKDALLALFKSMMKFRPDERPSIDEILGSEWIRKWALPDYEKMRNG